MWKRRYYLNEINHWLWNSSLYFSYLSPVVNVSMEHCYTPINGLQQEGVQTSGIWRGKAYAGEDFDILKAPREVGNFTQPSSYKKERTREWLILRFFKRVKKNSRVKVDLCCFELLLHAMVINLNWLSSWDVRIPTFFKPNFTALSNSLFAVKTISDKRKGNIFFQQYWWACWCCYGNQARYT